MSVQIRDTSYKKKSESWNDMEELKNLICAIDACKCPDIPPPPSRSIILPPRIEEIPCEKKFLPPRRPPCVPPPRCCPITPGPCCSLRLLPPPILPAMLPQPPLPLNLYCNSCSPPSCYLNK